MKKSLLSLSVMALLSTLVISCGRNNNSNSNENPSENASEVDPSKSTESTSEVEEIEKLPLNYVFTAKDVEFTILRAGIKINNLEMQFAYNEGKVTCQGNLTLTVEESDSYPINDVVAFTLVDDVLYAKNSVNSNFPSKMEPSYVKMPVELVLDSEVYNYANMTTADIVAIYKQYANQITKLLVEEIEPLAKKVVDKTFESLDALFDLDFSPLFTVKENADTIDYAFNYAGALAMSNDLASLSVGAFLDKYLGENVYSTIKDFAPKALDLTVTDLINGANEYCGLDIYELLSVADDVLALASEIAGQSEPMTVLGLINAPVESYEALLGEEGYGAITVAQLAKLEDAEVKGIKEQMNQIFATLDETPAYTIIPMFSEDSVKPEEIKAEIDNFINMLSEGTKIGCTTTKHGQLLSYDFATTDLYGLKGEFKFFNGKDFNTSYDYASIATEANEIIDKLSLTKANLDGILSYSYTPSEHYSNIRTPIYDENDNLIAFEETYKSGDYSFEELIDLSSYGVTLSLDCSGYYEVELGGLTHYQNSDSVDEYKLSYVDFYFNPTTNEYAEDVYHDFERTSNKSDYTCGDTVEFTITCNACKETETYTVVIKHNYYNYDVTDSFAYYTFDVTVCGRCNEFAKANILLSNSTRSTLESATDEKYCFKIKGTEKYDYFILSNDKIYCYYNCDKDTVDSATEKYVFYFKNRSSYFDQLSD